jgi:hypothetical protein
MRMRLGPFVAPEAEIEVGVPRIAPPSWQLRAG